MSNDFLEFLLKQRRDEMEPSWSSEGHSILVSLSTLKMVGESTFYIYSQEILTSFIDTGLYYLYHRNKEIPS